MLRRCIVVLAAAGLLMLQNGVCFSEDTSCEEGGWNPVSAGPLTTWTASLCGKGNLVLQPYLFFNRTRGLYDENGTFNELPYGDGKHQFQELVFLQYGITDRLEVDAQVVYQQTYISQGGMEAHANGLADSFLYLRYCSLEEKGSLPQVTGVFQLKLPTAKYEKATPDLLGTEIMGTGSIDPGIGIIATKKLKPFILHADASYSVPLPVTMDGADIHYAPYFNYDLGVEYFLGNGFNLLLEANGVMQGDQKQNGVNMSATRTTYLMVSPGIGWSNDAVQFLLGYQRGVAGINTDANDSVALTGIYTFQL